MKNLSLHILDIVQNSLRAQSSVIRINVNENENKNLLAIDIADDGNGIKTELLNEVISPFYSSRKTRKVGLGLSLFKQNTELANGNFSINSEKSKGTIVSAIMQLNHLDRLPLGDITGVIVQLIISNEEVRIIYNHSTEYHSFTIDSLELYDLFNDTDQVLIQKLYNPIRKLFFENFLLINSIA